jgi:hypothetical protein
MFNDNGKASLLLVGIVCSGNINRRFTFLIWLHLMFDDCGLQVH